MRVVFAGAWLLAGVVCWGAGAPVAKEGGRWQAVIGHLSSENFREREAGQRELGKATWRDVEVLRGLGKGAVDPEVQARVNGRVRALDEQIAVDPPPITVELEKTPFPEMVTRLGKAVGAPFTQLSNGGAPYTLHAVDRPFWDVVMALNGQSELAIGTLPGTYSLEPAIPGAGLTGSVRAGPALVHGVGVRGDASGTMWLACAVAVDPRMCVLQRGEPVYSSITDDGGRAWKVAAPVPELLPVEPATWDFRFSTQLRTEHGAKRVASAKGEVRLLVQATHEDVVVADVEKQGNAPMHVGRFTVVFDSVEGKGATLTMGMHASRTPPLENPMHNQDPLETAQVVVFDRAGQVVWTRRTDATGFRGSAAGTAMISKGGPYRAVLSSPTQVREVVVPFELKDVALPLAGDGLE